VVRPCNPQEASSSRELASLAVQRAPCLPNPLSMAVKASSMSPAIPGRRFDAAVPGPRRVAIISGPMGGRRCLRYGTLLKRGPCVRSSWCRSGSFNGTPRPGVARELPFKSHFKGEAKFFKNTQNQNTHGGCRCGDLRPSGTRPRERSEGALLGIEGGDLAAGGGYPLLANCRPEMPLALRVAATKSASRSLRTYTSI
jgi:hypothetical protein